MQIIIELSADALEASDNNKLCKNPPDRVTFCRRALDLPFA